LRLFDQGESGPGGYVTLRHVERAVCILVSIENR